MIGHGAAPARVAAATLVGGLLVALAGCTSGVATPTTGGATPPPTTLPTSSLQTATPAASCGCTAYATATSPAGAQGGTLVAWGDNSQGQTKVPAGLSNVVAISAGDEFAIALKSDGTVVGWGANDSGQATPPSGLSGVVSISAGSSHAIALMQVQ